MNTIPFPKKVARMIRRWNGSHLEWETDQYQPMITAIHDQQQRYSNRTTTELTVHAGRLRQEVQNGADPDELLIPAFALVSEAIRRILQLTPFDEQLMCGIALHSGKCAEMQTGEGKTIAAVFPAFLNALSGRGVHILTFNDYLAKRDAEWMGPVYNLLGLTVGCVQEGMDIVSHKAAYRCDVTYLTAKEAGFDFLRDNCAGSPEAVVQRDLHYAIIDEADSILIDEARIPLVIAETTRTSDTTLSRYTECAQRMRPEHHFTFNTYKRKIHLTDAGIDMAEETFECDNLYSADQCNHLNHLFHALHAEYLLERDVDYLVRNDMVEIVDELTGRIAENRRWPDGLHGAVEAKEHCPVNPRGAIRSSITMYHFIALYSRRCGMTATAESSEEELYDWYQLPTVIIPSHKPCIRTDFPDRVFATGAYKAEVLIDDIVQVHATGQPVLVGTRTVTESQHLAESLVKKGITCRLLNAKDDVYEAAIIAEAGRIGAITISTNMAGRGTDIKLGGSDNREYDAVAALGGLYVIGTNRFESRRIDNQLRGRSGRQGDPGCSRFFISLEDDLFIRYRLHELIPKQYRAESANGAIDNHYVNNEINRLQRIIEGQNSDIKFTLGKYAHLLEQQRRQIHAFRKGVLDSSAVPDCFKEKVTEKLSECTSHVGAETTAHLCRILLLHSIDKVWSSHLAAMADIRDGIHLIRYGNQDPLHVFNTLAIELFADIFDDIEEQAIDRFSSLDLHTIKTVLLALEERYAPSATWTYMVNDSPFKDEFNLSGNIGMSVVAGLYWPITMVMMLLKRGKQKKRAKD